MLATALETNSWRNHILTKLTITAQDANNNIGTLYFGYIDMNGMTFNLYPAINIVNGLTTDSNGNSNGISGTLGVLYTKNKGVTSAPDLVRSGTFSVTSVPGTAAYPQPPSQLGMGKTGTFYVYRI